MPGKHGYGKPRKSPSKAIPGQPAKRKRKKRRMQTGASFVRG